MKRSVILLCIILFLLTLTGCWDVRDVSNRAFVTSIGLDVADQAGSSDYKFTFSTVDPGKLRRQVRPASIVETVDAASLSAAIDELQSKTSRTITLGHLRLLVIGEELAMRRNFRDPLDAILKHNDIAIRLRMGVVQGVQALDILTAEPRFERTIAAEYVALAEQRHLSLARTQRLYDFVHDLRANNGTGFIPRIISTEDGRFFTRNGAAVFKDWMLVGWLTASETQAANWIIGETQPSVTAETTDGTYAYRVNSEHVSITPISKNDRIRFNLHIRVYGDVTQEQGQHLDLAKPQNVRKLEQAFAARIGQEVRGAVYKSQREIGADYLGFGRALEQSDPNTFRRLNWEEVYPEVPVNIEVVAKINTFWMSR